MTRLGSRQKALRGENKQLVVDRIVKEADRVLLFGEDPKYHVIARLDSTVNIGDSIEYEPYGVNFGWFVSVLPIDSKGGRP